MAKRTGLGKGLGALIPETVEGEAEGTTQLREVPIDAVVPNPYQPREEFDEEGLASLSDSIDAVGVLQPILVRPRGDQFELIAGERRWRAAQRAGLSAIPAVVREIEDVTSLEQAVVENLHRRDLNALEEASAYAQLIEDFQLTQEAVATRVGKSRSAVANTLRLLSLPPAIQGLLIDGQLAAGHGRALLALDDRDAQQEIARRAVDEQLSVRQVEDLVRDAGELPPSAPSPKPGDTKPAALLELEERLAEQLSTRVSVTMGDRRGKISISFADLDDLERLFTLITSS